MYELSLDPIMLEKYKWHLFDNGGNLTMLVILDKNINVLLIFSSCDNGIVIT